MTENYTALYEQHKKAGASFTDFGGWQMPLKYSSELAEHHAVRNAAGLFDLSHMGEVWVTGPEAAAFLDYALAGKLSAIAVGKAKYSLICNADGGIIDDLITYRRADDNFLVVPNAGNAKVVAAALKERAAGFDVLVEDASAETSLIAVQGPNAEAILLKLVPAEQRSLVTELKYYAAVEVSITFDGGTQDLLLARTGYTGEDGFEIYIPNVDAPGSVGSAPGSRRRPRTHPRRPCRPRLLAPRSRNAPLRQRTLPPRERLRRRSWPGSFPGQGKRLCWQGSTRRDQGCRCGIHHRPEARGPQGHRPSCRPCALLRPQGRFPDR